MIPRFRDASAVLHRPYESTRVKPVNCVPKAKTPDEVWLEKLRETVEHVATHKSAPKARLHSKLLDLAIDKPVSADMKSYTDVLAMLLKK